MVKIKNCILRKDNIHDVLIDQVTPGYFNLRIVFLDDRQSVFVEGVSEEEFNCFSKEIGCDKCSYGEVKLSKTEEDYCWNSEMIYDGITSVEKLIETLNVLCDLRRINIKNMDKESIESLNNTIDIVRNYVCKLFGGSINKKSDE